MALEFDPLNPRPGGAPPRNMRVKYEIANLPEDCFDATRANTVRTEANGAAIDAVVDYLDNRRYFQIPKTGLTVLGPPKSGKTRLLGSLLKSIITQDENCLIDELGHGPMRICFQEMVSKAHANFGQDLLIDAARVSPALFLDNIYGEKPPASVMAAMEARRDRNRVTFLAFRMNNPQDPLFLPVAPICQIFSDVNQAFSLPESILPHLTR